MVHGNAGKATRVLKSTTCVVYGINRNTNLSRIDSLHSASLGVASEVMQCRIEIINLTCPQGVPDRVISQSCRRIKIIIATLLKAVHVGRLISLPQAKC